MIIYWTFLGLAQRVSGTKFGDLFRLSLVALFRRWTVHPFIFYMNLCCASSRLLLRSATDSSTAKRSSFKARVECVRVNRGEQSVCRWKPIPTEEHTSENARAWRVEAWAKGTESTPVPLIGGNCDLWCLVWDSKDLWSRPEQVGRSK